MKIQPRNRWKGAWETKEEIDKEIEDFKNTLPSIHEVTEEWKEAKKNMESNPFFKGKGSRRNHRVPTQEEVMKATSSAQVSKITIEDRTRDINFLLGPASLREIERLKPKEELEAIDDEETDFMKEKIPELAEKESDMATILKKRMDRDLVPRIGNDLDKNWKIGDSIPYDEQVSAQKFVKGKAWEREQQRLKQTEILSKVQNIKLSPLSVRMPNQPKKKIENGPQTNVLFNLERKHQLEAVITAIDYLLLVQKTQPFHSVSACEIDEKKVLLHTKETVYDRLETGDFSRPRDSPSESLDEPYWFQKWWRNIKAIINAFRFWEKNKKISALSENDLEFEELEQDLKTTNSLSRDITRRLHTVSSRTVNYIQHNDFRTTFRDVMTRFYSFRLAISNVGGTSVQTKADPPSVKVREIEVRPSSLNSTGTLSTMSLAQSEDTFLGVEEQKSQKDTLQKWPLSPESDLAPSAGILKSVRYQNDSSLPSHEFLNTERKMEKGTTRERWKKKYNAPAKPTYDTTAYDKNWRLNRPVSRGAVLQEKATTFVSEKKSAAKQTFRRLESAASSADGLLTERQMLTAALKTVEVAELVSKKVGEKFDQTKAFRSKTANAAASGVLNAVYMQKKAEKIVDKQKRALFINDLIVGAKDADVILVLGCLHQAEDIGPGPIDVNQIDENGTTAIMVSFTKILEIDKHLLVLSQDLVKETSKQNIIQKEIRRAKRRLKKHENVFKVLLDAGADVDYQDKIDLKTGEGGMDNEWTMLHYACKAGNLKRVFWLVEEMGVEVDLYDQNGVTPLMLLAKGGHPTALLYLLGHGAGIEKMDARGWRPLHFAAHSAGSLTVKILLMAKADKESRDYEGRTASEVALSANRKNIYSLLEVYKDKPPIGVEFLNYLRGDDDF